MFLLTLIITPCAVRTLMADILDKLIDTFIALN